MSAAEPLATTRVIVIGSDVVRAGVAALLDDVADLEVVAAVASVSEARHPLRESAVPVVVLSVSAGDGSLLSALRDILVWNPAARVVVFTALTDDATLLGAIEAGAVGYLLKDATADTFILALRRIGAGEHLLDSAVRGRVLDHLRSPAPPALSDTDLLDPTELRIADLISHGWTNQRISEHLGVPERAVKRHVSDILRKLRVTRRSEVARYWARHRGGHSRGYLRREV